LGQASQVHTPHPDWYPGLDCGASLVEFQRYFYERCFAGEQNKCTNCEEPCGDVPPAPVPAPPPAAGGHHYDESYAVKTAWISQALDEPPHCCGEKAALRSWTCPACARVPGVSNVQIVEDIPTQTLAFVAQYRGECLVAFRGSKTPLNDEYNRHISFKWHPDSYGSNPSCYYCRIHSGYFDIWSALSPGVKSALQRLNCGDKRIQVTGHSLGGAIAALMAWELMDEYDVKSLYTLGEAPTGDVRWVEARRTRFANVAYFRITHYKDSVPLLHRIVLGGIPGARYHQAGPEVYYRSTRLGEYTVCPGGDDRECQHQWCTWLILGYTCNGDLGRHGSCDHCSYLGVDPCARGAAQFACPAP